MAYLEFLKKGKAELKPNGDICSSPRKEKQSKPQRWKEKRNPREESRGISNPKEDPSWRQKEVIPRCQRYNSKEDPSWHQKELIHGKDLTVKFLLLFGNRNDLIIKRFVY